MTCVCWLSCVPAGAAGGTATMAKDGTDEKGKSVRAKGMGE